MTPEHRRLLQITLNLTVILIVMIVAFIALVIQYNELEDEHRSTYAAFETCDDARQQGYAP